MSVETEKQHTTVPQLARYLMLISILLSALVLAACQPIAPVAPAAEEPDTDEAASTKAAAPMTDEEKITNAMSAAPMAIAKDATVRDWPAEPGGEAKELRAGTNGWLCRPDDPVSISNDPRCFDPAWQKIFGKAFGDERAANTMPGVSYMLQGGSVASNDDPTIITPAEGEEWQVDPPHVMIASPIPFDTTLFSKDHHSGGPWLMNQGTPLEHLMVPIETIEPVALNPETNEEKIANAMSAAPMAISQNATIRDWPAEPGGEARELRAGTNGWLCRPDDPVSISNDPRCFDPAWQKIFGKEFGTERAANTMPGVSYMLQGGSVASNDDPTIITPAEGEEWQIDPPHVMIASPIPFDTTLFSKDHHSGGPWLMNQGTPLEHLMVPLPEE